MKKQWVIGFCLCLICGFCSLCRAAVPEWVQCSTYLEPGAEISPIAQKSLVPAEDSRQSTRPAIEKAVAYVFSKSGTAGEVKLNSPYNFKIDTRNKSVRVALEVGFLRGSKPDLFLPKRWKNEFLNRANFPFQRALKANEPFQAILHLEEVRGMIPAGAFFGFPGPLENSASFKGSVDVSGKMLPIEIEVIFEPKNPTNSSDWSSWNQIFAHRKTRFYLRSAWAEGYLTDAKVKASPVNLSDATMSKIYYLLDAIAGSPDQAHKLISFVQIQNTDPDSEYAKAVEYLSDLVDRSKLSVPDAGSRSQSRDFLRKFAAFARPVNRNELDHLDRPEDQEFLDVREAVWRIMRPRH